MHRRPQQAGTALEPVHHELLPRVNTEPAVTIEEIGWCVSGLDAWLWAANSDTMHLMADTRGFDAATTFIDDDTGTNVRDMPRRRHTNARHQTCAAHILRRSGELDTDPPVPARGTPCVVADIVHTALDAEISPPMNAIRSRSIASNESSSSPRPWRAALMASAAKPAYMLRERDRLYTFLPVPSVEATNWRAERAIRPRS